MMKYKYGDIVIVEFPYSESNLTKKRPALIISSNNYNNKRKEILIAAITSNIKRVLYGDTKIENWQEAGLKFSSLVTGIVQTVRQSMINRKLGVFSKKDMQNVESNLKKIVSF